MRKALLIPCLALFFLSPAAGLGQKEKIFRNLSPEMLEDFLKELNIDYQKNRLPVAGYYYDFLRNNLKVRLSVSNGADLWITASFNPIPLEEINRWNQGAKFSRVVKVKNKDIEDSILEAQLDCAGGFTRGMIRQFILRFDDEIKSFSTFLLNRVTVEESFKNVSSERLEKVLVGLKISFKKTAGVKQGYFIYEFMKGPNQFRLHNFQGSDLMIDTSFPKAPLEEINKYNVGRKFVRAVIYQGKKGDFTSLEANLDCTGGVTDSIISYFIRMFENDALDFQRFLKGKGKPKQGEIF